MTANAALPAIYLAAGEGKRLRPLTDDVPKAMVPVGGTPIGKRALASLRRAGVTEVVAVTGHRAEALAALGELVSAERRNPRFANAGNVYSLWCARDVVERGCYVINSDVLFEDAIARRLVDSQGSAVLCSISHGVDEESMKAVAGGGRLLRLSKEAPVEGNAEYIGLTRVDPEHGPLLASILDERIERGQVHDYYEAAIEELAERDTVRVESVDGLAWIEIDDHEDLARAGADVSARVA